MISLEVLAFFSGAWKKVLSALDWIVKNPLVAICLVSLAFGFWEYRSANHWEAKDKEDNQHFAKEKADAIAAAEKQKAKYKKDSDDAQVLYQKLLADNGGLARMLSARRLQDYTLSAPAANKDSDPAVPAVAPSDAFVASGEDLRKCDADYSYALAAYEFIQSLTKDN